MAWVRPKHPPPKKPKADPVFSLVPILNYITSTNRPVSPTKAKQQQQHLSTAPLSRDPILRSFQQTQAIPEEGFRDQDSVLEDIPPKHHNQTKHHAPSRSLTRENHHSTTASQYSRTIRRDHRDHSPPPPPPPPLARPQPRVPSYERHHPAQVVAERYAPRPVDYPSYQERMASRATSARWASATAPLDIR
ncbi:MAG: hypothetical protein Q9168_002282 [Polycauliona sp. 1 TL-2023]